MSYYIVNQTNGMMAANTSEGEHDGKVTRSIWTAKRFSTYSQAYEFIQNFGDKWEIEEY